ncbi:uncharacterized protein LOC141614497 [Silene latifolia]|uniref:uncharacterized protein LOC141614497 n=1 Tax=Silene latifolia TaxID=37657 RepID=UPI003D7842A1
MVNGDEDANARCDREIAVLLENFHSQATVLEELRDLVLKDRSSKSPPRHYEEPRRNVDDLKVNELPEFNGGTDPENYLEWERKIERIFEFKDLNDEKCCKYAILKLVRNASLWYENLKIQRARENKEKINSWMTLKRKLRKRYVPKNYKQDLYRRAADLVQGSLSVHEYISEFEKVIMMCDVNELEEQKMARFMRGLNRPIANVVDMYPYVSFDDLCSLSLKVEKQQKTARTASFGTKSTTWSKNEGTSKFGGSGSSSKPQLPPKPEAGSSHAKGKERDLSKIRCFKCQGFGHYQSECPNKRIVTLRDAIEIRDEIYEELEEKEEKVETDEEIETEGFEAPIGGESLVIRRSLHAKLEPIDTEQREQLFHTRCLVKGKWCNVIIDGGSCTNVASTEMVNKLSLNTHNHPKPYKLHWLNDGNEVKVTKQTLVNFAMGSYEDEILCDVVPMDACHLLLGRPWQSDRDVTHRGRSNVYSLLVGGKKIELKPMSPKDIRTTMSKSKKPGLITIASAKDFDRELNKGGQVFAIFVKEGENEKNSSLEVQPLLQPLMEKFHDVFPEDLPPGLPPMRGIEHQIDLIPGAALPNKAPYRCNPDETKELQRQIEELMERGYVRESLSPCATALLVPKKDGTWRMCIDSRASTILLSNIVFLFLNWMICLMNYMGRIIFSKIDLRSWLSPNQNA